MMTIKPFDRPPIAGGKCFLARDRSTLHRSGIVLVVVLVVVALLALSAYTFTELMLAERAGAELHADSVQSQALTQSGVAAVRAFVLQPDEMRTQLGGAFHNPDQFQNRVVNEAETAELTGMFSVISPELDSEGYPLGPRSGLTDESSKININVLLDTREDPTSAGQTGQATGQAASSSGSNLNGTTLGTPGTGGPTSTGPTSSGPTSSGPTSTGPTSTGPTSTGPTSSGPTSSGPTSTGPTSTGPISGGTNAVGNSTGASNSTDPADDPLKTANDPRQALMALPGMTLEIADAILDWIDDDDLPREFGAEIDFYSALQPSYMPRNGPIRSIDELLLVRGVTPALLYGRDQNRNFQLDQDELAIPLNVEYDPALGSIELGWAPYITVDNRESNLNPLGEARIDLNGEDLEQLHTDLSAVVDVAIADFIILYRQFGPYEGNSTDAGEPYSGTLDFSKESKTELKSILDVIGARAEIDEQGDKIMIASPLVDQPIALSTQLANLLDYTMTSAEEAVTGRVNINQAPLPVLMSIPGMSIEIANAILSNRAVEPDLENPIRNHAVWLFTESFVTLDEMRAMMPYVNGGGDLYRAQIVGYFGDGSKANRVEVVINGTEPDAPLLLWKDMTHLGAGFVWDEVGGGVAQ